MTAVLPVMAYDYGPVVTVMEPGEWMTTREISVISGKGMRYALELLHTAVADGKVEMRCGRWGYEWTLKGA